MAMSAASDPLTIGDLMSALGVDPTPEWLDWPPDVFAIVATILKKTGTYTALVHRWPLGVDLSGTGSEADWIDHIMELGTGWRKASEKRLSSAPSDVATWWQIVLDHRPASADDIKSNDALTNALLQLCACADEACRGVGVPSGAGSISSDRFDLAASTQLSTLGTLSRRVSATRLRVLPKLHTPRSGMTLRSLTHNLALCPSEDVSTSWKIAGGGPEEGRGLNLLLLPWPRRVMPRQFTPVEGFLQTMPESFGFFRFNADVDAAKTLEDAVAAFKEAEHIVGTVHGVILPELALTPDAYRLLRQEITATRKAFLITGIGEAAAPNAASSYDRNYFTFDVFTPFEDTTVTAQDKHHRWKLSRSQILQYGCGANLSHVKEWWEFIGMSRRELTFVAMNPWLTMSVLICEDLARQDPVGEILRAVGPNLVIALLMDGPQLAARWPARYATVLADDPGSSVLTLTSIGMSQLSRPPGKPPSRVVALWKDAITAEPIEISLPESADAIVLTLSAEYHEEWTADGRSDNESTGYAVLAGVHPISLSGRSTPIGLPPQTAPAPKGV